MSDEIEEEKPLTLVEWEKFFERASAFSSRAADIAGHYENTHSASFVGFTDTGDVLYSYHDGCGCHGQTAYSQFPAYMLFDEKAIENIKAQRERDKVAKADKERKEAEAAKAKKEADERKQLEVLKNKYEVRS